MFGNFTVASTLEKAVPLTPFGNLQKRKGNQKQKTVQKLIQFS